MEKTFRITGTTDATRILDGGDLGFLAYSLYIDNPTNQWLAIAPYGFVAPYTLANVLPLGGVQRISIRNVAPSGITNPTIISTEGPIVAIAYSERDLYRPGLPLGKMLRVDTIGIINVTTVDPPDTFGMSPTDGARSVSIALQAPSTNPGSVFVQQAALITATAYELVPGASLEMDNVDPSALQFWASVPLCNLNMLRLRAPGI
jgi:hypothetical protein